MPDARLAAGKPTPPLLWTFREVHKMTPAIHSYPRAVRREGASAGGVGVPHADNLLVANQAVTQA